MKQAVLRIDIQNDHVSGRAVELAEDSVVERYSRRLKVNSYEVVTTWNEFYPVTIAVSWISA